METASLVADRGDPQTALLIARGRFHLPEMPKGAGPSAQDRSFLSVLEKEVEEGGGRLSVRAMTMSTAELISLCRFELERVAVG
jgi:hypothetical protein